jgi:acyl-CoA reductase-like NAD-dependent aldehyde dehydrogenase
MTGESHDFTHDDWSEGLFVGDCGIQRNISREILAGIVNVNSPTVNDEIHAPMGGVRDGGWGRTRPRSLDDFSDVIWINSHAVSASIHSDRKVGDRRNQDSSR